jgi:hypothetical protein
MLSNDACICRAEEISLCKGRTIVVILLLLLKQYCDYSWNCFTIVSLAFFFVIICALWFINMLSVTQIYCFGNDLYTNRSPRGPINGADLSGPNNRWQINSTSPRLSI